ncbi:MAG: cell division protein FtsQ/DivIB [Alphaproteobacteria bacterium]
MNPGDIIVRAAATVPSPNRRAHRQGELALPPVRRRAGESVLPARSRWARRWQRQRTRLRRNLRMLLLACLLTSPLWLWQAGHLKGVKTWISGTRVQVSSAARLTLARVRIEGRRQASIRAIKQALGARRGTPILDFDLLGAKARIEALPWVARAVVERRLPDTIHVGISERRPIARWRLGGATLLVDADGVAIRTDKLRQWSALPLIAGPGAPAAAGRLLEILARQPRLAKRIVSSRRLGKRRWDIVFDNGVVLMLPQEKPAAAWRRFARLEAKHHLLARGLVVVDLRLADRVILRAPGKLPPPPQPGGPGRST